MRRASAIATTEKQLNFKCNFRSRVIRFADPRQKLCVWIKTTYAK